MLEELLKFDFLGTRKELNFVLFQALVPGKEQRISEVVKFCKSSMFSINRSIDGILYLLRFIEFIDLEGEYISLNINNFDPRDFYQEPDYFQNPHFFKHLLSKFLNDKQNIDFFSAEVLKLSHVDRHYYLKSNHIKLEYFPIRNLFLNLSFLEKRPHVVGNLYVSEKFHDIFNELIINELQIKTRAKFTLSQLKSSIKRKEEVGGDAEIFVLNFEKARLKGHPSLERVERISLEYVNAGFDIISFNDADSLIHDRFIEVKSFQNELSFYWSKNEIHKAKELSDKYFLYLVDRSKMVSQDYLPKIFQNPYEKIFESELWKKETENWKIWFDDED